MAFDQRSGGHEFQFHNDVCAKCGMKRKNYEDRGKPPCSGKKRDPMPIPND
jgi:hypothetical protein